MFTCLAEKTVTTQEPGKGKIKTSTPAPTTSVPKKGGAYIIKYLKSECTFFANFHSYKLKNNNAKYNSKTWKRKIERERNNYCTKERRWNLFIIYC